MNATRKTPYASAFYGFFRAFPDSTRLTNTNCESHDCCAGNEVLEDEWPPCSDEGCCGSVVLVIVGGSLEAGARVSTGIVAGTGTGTGPEYLTWASPALLLES